MTLNDAVVTGSIPVSTTIQFPVVPQTRDDREFDAAFLGFQRINYLKGGRETNQDRLRGPATCFVSVGDFRAQDFAHLSTPHLHGRFLIF